MFIRLATFVLIGSLGVAACRIAPRSYVPLEGVALGGGSVAGGGQGVGDPDAPIVLLSAPPAKLQGGASWTFDYTLTAQHELVAAQLQYARDGESVTSFISVDPAATQGSFELPRDDVDGARFSLVAIDAQGKLGRAVSAAFSVDSTSPTVPSFLLDVPALTNQRAVSLVIPSCADAAALILVEDATLVAAAAPEWFWQPCVAHGTRAAAPSILLEDVDGPHTLFVWARDEVSNATPAPVSVPLTLDTTAPQLTLSPLASVLPGGEVLSVAYLASDAYGLGALELTLSAGGSTLASQHVAVAESSAAILLDIPQTDITGASLSARLFDAAGNSALVTQGSLVIDATLPLPHAIGATGLTAIANVAVTVSSCADAPFVLVSENATRPAPDATGWQDCSTAAGAFTIALAPTQGVHTLHGWFKDAAGNVSLTATSANVDFDSLAPSVALTVPGAGVAYKPNLPLNITWTALDAHFGATPLVLELSNDAGANWQPIASAVANTGSLAWTTPALEGDYQLRLSAIDLLGQQASASVAFSVDGTPPTVTSVVINGGDASTATIFTTTAVTASDTKPTAFRFRLREVPPGTACAVHYADDAWRDPGAASQSLALLLTPLDGNKKICAWAKDDAANVNPNGAGFDTIDYFVGNPPVVRSFSVHDAGGGRSYALGAPVSIDWRVTDVEGLTDQPIELAYTTNDTNWQLITPAYGPTGSTGDYTDSYPGFLAPSSGYFRVRIRAADKNGNTSIAVTSDAQNTPAWSIYLGTDDVGIGGGALSAELSTPRWNNFAISPKTNDIYAMSEGVGVLKLNARTGRVSRLLEYGPTNLPDSGPLPADARVGTSNLWFDSAGRLVLLVAAAGSTVQASSAFYQIDLETNQVTRLLGGVGATDPNAGASKDTAFVLFGSFTLDELDALHYFTSCAPGAFITAGYDLGTPTPLRLMRATRASDGTVTAVSQVAGSCVGGATDPGPGAGPFPALTTVLSQGQYAVLAGLGAYTDPVVGAVVYYSLYNSDRVYKVIGGNIFATSIPHPASGLVFLHPQTHHVFTSASPPGYDGIYEFASGPSGPSGPTGEVQIGLYANGAGSGDCVRDGVNATLACVNAYFGMAAAADGTVFFTDGPGVSHYATYRIRYRDAAATVRTIFGSLPFFSDGLARNVVRGRFGGIAWKNTDTPGFLRGLYFNDRQAPLFARVEDDSGGSTIGAVEVLWGNQQGNDAIPANGTALDATQSMGPPYSGGDGYPLAFDPVSGGVWLRARTTVVRMSSAHTLERVQAGGYAFWEDFLDGRDPREGSLYVFGGVQNFTFKNQGLFLIGGYPTLGHAVQTHLSLFDFGALTVKNLMGGSASGSAPDAPSGPVTPAMPLPAACLLLGPCYLNYRAADDRLYIMEQIYSGGQYSSKLRWIGEPGPSGATGLGSVTGATFSAASEPAANFAFDPRDANRLFYIRGGGLFCRRLGGTADWCDDTRLNPAVSTFSIGNMANQFSFDDPVAPTKLFISSGDRFVFRYDLPP
ncbi:MAG: hypothetical protein IT381_23250 [Deltaproteobacteria bacterium]|nr:hypothetical protein [Deltaproteobacteria bacterium]